MIIDKKVLSFRGKITDYGRLSSNSWARLNDQPGQNAGKINVIINSQQGFQTFQGTGAAFSEIGGKVLFSLNEGDKKSVMSHLFSKHDGAGFSYCRLPIGSSDFALSAYSLNDTIGDYDMEAFSLSRDEDYLIPFIKEAYKYSKALRIHASPWSPPAWLKTNNDFLFGGSLIDNEQTYKAYAKYLGKFIRSYLEKGLIIDKLLVQNEPDSAANFPSCVMQPIQMVKFVTNYLKPHFDKEGIDAEIWAGTFRTITGLQAQESLKSETFRKVIQGVGFQYALTEHIYDLKMLYPKTRVMHTETPCYRGENSWEQAITLFDYFVDYMNVGCEIFSYWNMILDEKAKSTWGWKQNSLVTIKDNQEIIYNPDYYIMSMISQNIRPGAIRIESVCLAKKTIVFKNVDGSIILLVCNLNDKDMEMAINLDGHEHNIELPGSSIMCVTLK